MLGLAVFLSLALASPALANTEIVNFVAKQARDFDSSAQSLFSWPILNASTPERRSFLDPMKVPEGTSWAESFKRAGPPGSMPHELWLALDIDSFLGSTNEDATFTLRISWPAWTPVDFQIDVFDASDLANLMTPSPPRSQSVSRRQYARIRAKNAGVPVDESIELSNVIFNVILEKLNFGVLPPSVVPTLQFILASLLPSAVVVWVVARVLNPLVNQARQEFRVTTE